MEEKPQTVRLAYYGISPWEIEVIYGLFNGKFSILQEETEQNKENFVSALTIDIPLPFSEEFFKWFEFRAWERVKSIIKEMKRRRGKGNNNNNIPSDTSEVLYKYDIESGKWKFNQVWTGSDGSAGRKKFIFTKKGWNVVT